MEIQTLKGTVLFKNMDEAEIREAVSKLHAQEKHYQKGELIFQAGDRTESLGLVLSGSVTIENNDLWGNRTILSHVGVGQVFAETFALLKEEPLLVDVVANENCSVVFLRVGSAFAQNVQESPWASKLLRNLLKISTHKNLMLSGRNFHTAPKTIRGRVTAYLNTVSLQKHSREFDIPFDRQQLADYLNVERSALSKELGKMQRDRMLTVRKNHFVLAEVSEKQKR